MTTCQDQVKALAERLYKGEKPMGDKAIDTMVNDIEKYARGIKYQNPALDDAECMERAADVVQSQMEHEAFVARQRAYLNVLARDKNMDFLKSKEYDIRWAQAFLDGNPRLRGKGAAASLTNTIGGSLELTFGGPDGLITQMRRAKVYNEVFLNKAKEADLAEAIWKVRHNEADQIADKDVRKCAEIIQDISENLRRLQNKHGADIQYLADRLTRNRHNPFRMILTDSNYLKHLGNEIKILAANKGNPTAIRIALRELAFKRWKNFQLAHLNHGLTFINTDFSDVAKDNFLREVWENILSRTHDRMDLTLNGDPAPHRGASFARRLSKQRRVLIYKDGASELAQQRMYGYGSLKDAVLHEFENSSISRAILQKMGPNADFNWEQMKRVLKVKNKALGDKINGILKKDDRIWRRINGTASTPVSYSMARLGQNIRSFTTLARLGLVTIRSLSDVALGVSEMRFHGVGFLDAWSDQIANLKNLFHIPKDQYEFFDVLGTTADHMIGSYNRFGINEGVGGLMTDLNRLFFKINFLKHWDYTLRQGAKAGVSRWLALNKANEWEKLRPQLQNALELRGLGEKEWELMRNHPMKDSRGKEYITPDAYKEASDEEIAAYLNKSVKKLTPEERQNVIEDLELAHMSWLHDVEQHVILTPTAADQEVWLRGQEPGTILGELLRMVAQFKMFSTAFSRRVIFRQLMQTDPSRMSLQAIAELAAATVALTYVSQQAYNIINNRTPTDPRLIKGTANKMAFWGRMITPAMGIYGDFLAGEYNRYGGDLTDVFEGPVLSNVNDIYKIINDLVTGQSAKGTFKRLANQNIPFLSVWGMSNVFKLLFLHAMADHINQGEWQRSVRRMQDNYGERPIITPF